jgi:integrase
MAWPKRVRRSSRETRRPLVSSPLSIGASPAGQRKREARSCPPSVRLAGLGPNALGKVTPHTLRHTAATWLMQAGVDMWEAAGFLGMSVAVLEKTYGHHHPNHLQNAARGIGYGTRKRVSVVERNADESKPRKVV